MTSHTQHELLISAVKAGDAAEVRKLLDAEADPNVKDILGLTPLHLAAKGNREEVAYLLLKFGADPEAVDNVGRTPIHYAVESESESIVEFLAQYKAPNTHRGGRAAQIVSPLPPIMMNGNTLDRSIQPAIDASNTNYILVQSRKRLGFSQKKELEKHGLVLHGYVSQNAYLCGYRDRDLDKIRRMDDIIYVDAYRPELKIPPNLKDSDPNISCEVDIVFHKGTDWKSTHFRDLIAHNAELSEREIHFFPNKARLTTRSHCWNNIALVDDVRCIEKVGKIVPFNDQAREILSANVYPHMNAAQDEAFKGEGQAIAIADTGFDTGQKLSPHPAFGDRVLELYPMGGHPADSDGHGTHVSGSAVGDGLTFGDPSHGIPSLRIMGAAPRAHLVVQCLGSNFERFPEHLGQLFKIPYEDHGVRVHSNSWGLHMHDKQHRYAEYANEIDTFVWEHQDTVICLAAGNDAADVTGTGNVGHAHIGGPAAAKNCITVGASENFRPGATDTYGDTFPTNFPLPPISSCLEAEDPTQVACFSSRGPTVEKRYKPDIVAPGTSILSAKSVYFVNPDRPGPDSLWCYMSGTSMATPLVAGCAAVLREVLINAGISRPSAALIKALLVNGADILSSPTPNIDSGFGRVNLATSISIANGEERTAFREGVFGQSNERSYSFQFAVDFPSANLKATLVWSDPPDEQLQNLILLEVKLANSNEHRAYDPRDYNNLNNIQQILLKNIPIGNTTITVKTNDEIIVLPQPFTVSWRLY